MLEYNENEYEIGVDEVGRGCLAGPVVAAAVIWDYNLLNSFIKKGNTC